MNIGFSEFTSQGAVRDNNQDSILAISEGYYGLFVVADGMGGHFGGEIASSCLVDELKKWWDTFVANKSDFENCCEDIKKIMTDVNRSIYTEYSQSGKICGTTVALVFLYEDKYLLLNVGDSRVYSLEKGKFRQESVDHVFSAEAKLKGDLTEAEINEHRNKNKLTSAIGCKESFKMNVRTAPLTDRVFFICSDGVYKYCDESSVKKAMRQRSTEKALSFIKQRVETGGAGDNFSFIRIIVGEPFSSQRSDPVLQIIGAAVIVLIFSVLIGKSGDDTPELLPPADTEETEQLSVDEEEREEVSVTETVPVYDTDEDEAGTPELEYEKIYFLGGKSVIFYENGDIEIDNVPYTPSESENTRPENVLPENEAEDSDTSEENYTGEETKENDTAEEDFTGEETEENNTSEENFTDEETEENDTAEEDFTDEEAEVNEQMEESGETEEIPEVSESIDESTD